VSVINKMLRDLDARRAGGSLPQLQRQGGPDALQGTVSVGAAAASSAAQGRRWWLATVLLLAGSGLAAWYILDDAMEQPTAPVSPVVVTVAPPASAPVVTVAAPAPEPAASAPADTASAPLAAASSAAPAAIAVAASAAQPAASAAAPAKRQSAGTVAAVAQEPRASATASPAAKESQRRPAEQSARAAAPVAKPVAPKAAVPAAAPTQRRQAAAEETLAQAQALWAAGTREAALDLVREAALLAERSQPPDAALLAMLVREQTRMELALGRPAAVLELLTRLEPRLSAQADLWAVRGNAAQRLGRHPESVQAYLMALQLRPGESRWMLGAAVSLAAQGQLDAAAQQAERARALGPVSPEVLSYLRQAGVPLR
jgi:tetratricopeptide (TPR) repeat protein